MNKIIITKEEIKACKQKARELSEDYDCYYYYRQRDKQFDELLQEKTGMKNITFDLNGGDLMYDERVANVHPPTKERVYKEDGFTPDEYTALTKQPVPNQWYNNLIAVDEDSGKVHSFEQNGNVSINMGAPVFSKKYKHLIKSVWTKCSIEVEII